MHPSQKIASTLSLGDQNAATTSLSNIKQMQLDMQETGGERRESRIHTPAFLYWYVIHKAGEKNKIVQHIHIIPTVYGLG